MKLLKKNKKMKIGLSLAGGASRGTSLIGITQVLFDANIPIDYLSGTSYGALAAAGFACGSSKVGTKVAERMRSKDIFSLYEFLRARGGFTRVSRIRKRQLRHYIPPEIQFCDLEVPLFVSAYDLVSHTYHVFTEGSVLDAVCASISFPIAFAPVSIGNHKFIDGAGMNYTMIDIMKQKVDFVIACYPLYDLEEPKYTPYGKLKLGIKIFLQDTINTEFKTTPPDFSILPKILGQSDFDYSQKSFNTSYYSGKKIAQKNIPALKKAIQVKEKNLGINLTTP